MWFYFLFLYFSYKINRNFGNKNINMFHSVLSTHYIGTLYFGIIESLMTL